jgi:hypothetical protein
MSLCISLLAWAMVGTEAPPEAALRIRALGEGGRVELRAVLPEKLRAIVPEGRLNQEQGEKWLRLMVLDEKREGPAMLGNYERRGAELVFRPRHPLAFGQKYRARLGTVTIEYQAPVRKGSPLALVEKVYPTSKVLPANHLKFHIHFSRPMRGGKDIFDHIRILDAKGNVVHDPWLRDELWDESYQKLILYIHPGRIKWGVLLRMLLGPVLEPDREYTLVIDPEVLDADGQRLGKEHRYKFRTSAEDRTPVAVAAWKVRSPAAHTRAPVALEFPRVLDRVSLERFLKVVDAQGKAVAGTIEVGEEERSWQFRPREKWQPQEYTIRVDERLEDVAGNTPGRPFDRDLRMPLPAAPRLVVQFRVK